jgi:hypothetical protein
MIADPGFDFDASFRTFVEGYRLPLDAVESVRGSRSGELISRCLVETGTHTFYSALADSTDEPVLKEICGRIAADEAAHYALFHHYLERYHQWDRLGLWQRLRIAFARVSETQDDELAHAYYAANGSGRPYDRRENARAYSRTALRFYRDQHHQRAAEMFFQAVGLSASQGIGRVIAALACRVLGLYVRHLGGAVA